MEGTTEGEDKAIDSEIEESIGEVIRAAEKRLMRSGRII
jgi:hypothetical protein